MERRLQIKMQLRKHIQRPNKKKSHYNKSEKRQPKLFVQPRDDVTKHLTEKQDHSINFNDVVISAQSDHWRKLLIKETLLIHLSRFYYV